jgi:aldehyde:ferredoxin oxidoreductase
MKIGSNYARWTGDGKRAHHVQRWLYRQNTPAEPIKAGASTGQLISLQDLDEYYEVRGWDKDGKPTAARLEELGLK